MEMQFLIMTTCADYLKPSRTGRKRQLPLRSSIMLWMIPVCESSFAHASSLHTVPTKMTTSNTRSSSDDPVKYNMLYSTCYCFNSSQIYTLLCPSIYKSSPDSLLCPILQISLPSQNLPHTSLSACLPASPLRTNNPLFSSSLNIHIMFLNVSLSLPSDSPMLFHSYPQSHSP